MKIYFYILILVFVSSCSLFEVPIQYSKVERICDAIQENPELLLEIQLDSNSININSKQFSEEKTLKIIKFLKHVKFGKFSASKTVEKKEGDGVHYYDVFFYRHGSEFIIRLRFTKSDNSRDWKLSKLDWHSIYEDF
jgi:hypothetical protein